MRRTLLALKRCAVYGGAFDPPTEGHIACIRQLLGNKNIDEVIVMPCGNRADKPQMSDKVDRMSMVQIAVNTSFINEEPVFVSRTEYNTEGGLATYDLLKTLESQDSSNDYVFVVGSDWLSSSSDIRKWTSAEGPTGDRLLKEYDFAVIPRPGSPIPDLTPYGPRFSVIGSEDQSIDISSTEIRGIIQHKAYDTIIGYVPSAVINYLKRNKLYNS